MIAPRAMPAMFLTAGILAACSPCAGVLTCTESEHLAVQGRVIQALTGDASRGTTVTLTGGGASATTTTDATGTFQIRLATASSGRFSLRVAPIGLPGYTIDSIPCAPVVIHGDGCVINPIVEAPWVPIHALITYRGSEGALVKNADVTFNRIQGASWLGPRASESIGSHTDDNGVALLFPPELYASANDTIVGDLLVKLPDPLGVSVRRGFVVRPVVGFTDRPVDIFSVGPSLAYRLRFTDSATLAPVSGVTVSFTRTAGIAIAPTAITAASDTTGFAPLVTRALGVGDVTGDLQVRAPGAAASNLVPGFTLTTFDTDSSRLGGAWRIGRTGIIYRVP